MKPKFSLLSASLLLGLLAPLPTLAAAVTWTNAAGDFRWNNADLAAEGWNLTLISPSPVDSTPHPISVDGDDAVFGATIVRASSVDASTGVCNLTVHEAGHSFSGPNTNSALIFADAAPS